MTPRKSLYDLVEEIHVLLKGDPSNKDDTGLVGKVDRHEAFMRGCLRACAYIAGVCTLYIVYRLTGAAF